MSACETCMTEFSCDRLAMALKLVEAMPDLDQWPRLSGKAAHIRRILAEAGWDYPLSAKPCELAPITTKIQKLTQDLITEIDLVRWKKTVQEQELSRP